MTLVSYGLRFILIFPTYHLHYFFICRNSSQWARASSFTKFLDHTQWHTTVGRTSDQLVAETSDNTQHSQQTDIHAPGGIRTHNLSSRAAAGLRLRSRGQWDRHHLHLRPPNGLFLYLKFICISPLATHATCPAHVSLLNSAGSKDITLKMKLDGSLLQLPEPTTCPCSKPDESRPRLALLFL